MLKIIRSNKTSQFAVNRDPSEINGDNLNNIRREASRHSGIKRGNIRKTNLISLQGTVRTKTLDPCIGD
jgi:hypothetical protein